MSTAFETLARAYAERTEAARAWRAEGGRVVGYVCDNVPAELIRASGFMPFRLYGDDVSSRAETADRITSFHARRYAGAEFVEAIYGRIVAGDFDFLDYLVIPHNRKIVASLMQSVENLRPHRPEGSLPEIHFLDRTYTESFRSGVYNRDSFLQLAGRLEAWSGAAIDRENLSTEVETANAVRGLIRELNGLRAGGEPRISGTEALQVMGAAFYLEPQVYQPLVRDFIAEARARAPLAGRPVYLGGSPWDHAQFYEAVEASGGVIVAEDHCWGARCSDLMLAGDDLLMAMADRFNRQPACSVQGSIDNTIRAVVTRAVASGAKAAIFANIKGDLAQTWESPSEIEALRAEGVASLLLRGLAYAAPASDAVKSEIAAFLADPVAHQSQLGAVA